MTCRFRETERQNFPSSAKLVVRKLFISYVGISMVYDLVGEWEPARPLHSCCDEVGEAAPETHLIRSIVSR